MNKKLENEVENFNKNTAFFNLIKSKKSLDKSGYELSEKFLLNNNLKKRDIKKISANAKQIEYLLETAEYRTRNIKLINEKAVYIQKINEDINILVNKQKDVIEKICDNIDPTTKHSKDTYTNLLELSGKNKLVKNRKCYFVLLVSAFVIFMTIILINRFR
jgi:hypothetical protein